MAVEVELKYLADGPAVLSRLAAVESLGQARLGPATTVREIDRYLDTPDGRLAAARWAARLRRRGDRTVLSMKGPIESGPRGSLHRRPELEVAANDALDPDTWQRGEATALLRRIAGDAALVEWFVLRQERTERPVLAGETRIGTLSLDVVGVEAGGEAHGSLHVVELELADDGMAPDEADLDRLDAALRAVGGLHPDPQTKLEHALALLPPP